MFTEDETCVNKCKDMDLNGKCLSSIEIAGYRMDEQFYKDGLFPNLNAYMYILTWTLTLLCLIYPPFSLVTNTLTRIAILLFNNFALPPMT
jgi:hypothetical protein